MPQHPEFDPERREEWRMQTMSSDATFFRRLLTRTKGGDISWTATRRHSGSGSQPAQILEFKRGDMTVTLDRCVGPDDHEYRSYIVWWELFPAEHLLPGDGVMFRHPEAEVAFDALWAEASRGVDWDALEIEGDPDPLDL